VIAVATTAARTLEASAGTGGGWLETDLLITPGYQWMLVGGMVTNFHLPRSTLMAMIAALLPGGVDQLHAVYAAAIAERYRFYSYGDAMLILP
ncbi:MAG: S-adenosylmethionine:tRNA ribosyltransferase-isomerase, partial [Phycisphaerales bacterium]|nr:S-adenosylmethionine:tRNA ribosyltransferase-isomerase [Phycisphaerales bacterium]